MAFCGRVEDVRYNLNRAAPLMEISSERDIPYGKISTILGGEIDLGRKGIGEDSSHDRVSGKIWELGGDPIHRAGRAGTGLSGSRCVRGPKHKSRTK